MNDFLKPILTDEQGDWYTMIAIAELAQRTPERIRQWTVMDNPLVVKDKSRGVILFRLADGCEFSENGGIRRKA